MAFNPKAHDMRVRAGDLAVDGFVVLSVSIFFGFGDFSSPARLVRILISKYREHGLEDYLQIQPQ